MNGAETNPSARSGAGITLGLRENWQQFSLLVLINAFVGGMVGLERTVVPLIGSEEFKIASTMATCRSTRPVSRPLALTTSPCRRKGMILSSIAGMSC